MRLILTILAICFYGQTAAAAEAVLPIKVKLEVDCKRQAKHGRTPIKRICEERGECCDLVDKVK